MAEMTREELLAKIQGLEKLNATLTASKPSNGLGFKVSEKGAVSIYGVGRFPVTLYPSQVVAIGKIFGAPSGCPVYKFVQANADGMSFKDDAQKAEVLAQL